MDRILRGTVTRVDSQGVYVEVPKLGLGVEYGPAEVYGLPMLEDRTQLVGDHTHSVSVSDGTTSSSGSTSATGAHQHTVVGGRAALRPRDKVLVATVNGVKEDLVVLGRLA